MNVWILFSCMFLVGMIPVLLACLRGRMLERFVALQMAQIFAVLIMMLMAEGFARDIYFDAALALALLTFAGSLVFVRFLERWL